MTDINTPITLADNTGAIAVLQQMRATLAYISSSLGNDVAATQSVLDGSVTIAEVDALLESILLLGVPAEDVTLDMLKHSGSNARIVNIPSAGSPAEAEPVSLDLLSAASNGYAFLVRDGAGAATGTTAHQTYAPALSQDITPMQITSSGGVTNTTLTPVAPVVAKLRTKCTGIPPGTVVPYLGDVAPPGWILCNGSAVSGDNVQILRDVLGGRTSLDMRGLYPRTHDASGAVDTDTRYTTLAQTAPSSSPLSVQNDAMRTHTHYDDLRNIITHDVWGEFYQPTSSLHTNGWYVDAGYAFKAPINELVVGPANTYTMGASGTATETEPPSVIVNFIMKL